MFQECSWERTRNSSYFVPGIMFPLFPRNVGTVPGTYSWELFQLFLGIVGTFLGIIPLCNMNFWRHTKSQSMLRGIKKFIQQWVNNQSFLLSCLGIVLLSWTMSFTNFGCMNSGMFFHILFIACTNLALVFSTPAWIFLAIKSKPLCIKLVQAMKRIWKNIPEFIHPKFVKLIVHDNRTMPKQERRNDWLLTHCWINFFIPRNIDCDFVWRQKFMLHSGIIPRNVPTIPRNNWNNSQEYVPGTVPTFLGNNGNIIPGTK